MSENEKWPKKLEFSEDGEVFGDNYNRKIGEVDIDLLTELFRRYNSHDKLKADNSKLLTALKLALIHAKAGRNFYLAQCKIDRKIPEPTNDIELIEQVIAQAEKVD